jgi:CheY-like chemotaxis protein
MSREQKRILLVEPEPVLAEVTGFRLELLGYHVTLARSAEDALTRMSDVQPDVIITDLTLPGLDGMGLIERLASDEKASGIPIIVLSIDADLDFVQTAYNLGASDYVVVPYHPEVLEEKVARHVAGPRRKRQPGGKAAVE